VILQGTLVNILTVLVGGTLGCLFKRIIPEKSGELVQKGLGLCVIFIGIEGAMTGASILPVIFSVAIGALIGEGLRLEQRLESLGDKLQAKMKGKGGSVSEAFVTASLLFCVGAMSVVGSVESGLGNHTTIYTKALLDGFMAMVFASRLGNGVLFSCFVILIYQGAFELLAGVVAPYMTDPLTAMLSCVGNILIMGIGINLVFGKKVSVMNLVPAIFLCVPMYYLFEII